MKVVAHGASPERLIGRDDELRALERALADAQAGGTPAVALVGEPGIGKTTLLRRACDAAEAAGFRVLGGRGSEFEREVPFALVIDALDQPLASLEPALLRHIGDELLAELAAVLPGLSGAGGDPPSALDSERYRCHYAIRAALEQLSRQSPLIVALDDVQWADPASLEVLAHLVRHPIPRTLLALAYRPYQAPRQLAAALALADHDGALTKLQPAPLSLEEAGQLVGDAFDAAAVRFVHAESGGNPFYLEQIARTARRSTPPGLPAMTDDSGSPEAVRTAIVRELARASSVAQRLIDAAAVEGERFELDVAAEIAGLDRRVALAALDELVALDIVRETMVPGRFAFRHPIVRRAVYDAASPGSRMLAHERAARALTQRGAAIGAVAHHVERAALPGDEAAIDLLTTAGAAAAARAPASAARWYASALRLLPTNAPVEQRLSLLESQATALATVGRLQESADVLMKTLELVPARSPAYAGITALIARTELGMGRGPVARRLLTAALDDAEADPKRTIGLQLELAATHVMECEWDTARDTSTEAHRLAASLGDHVLTLTAAAHTSLYTSYCGEFADALGWADEAAGGIDALSDAELTPQVLEGLVSLSFAEVAMDRLVEAERHVERALRVGRAAGHGYLFLGLMLGQGMTLMLQGRLEAAQVAADAGAEAASLLGNDQWLAAVEGVRCWVASLQGDLSVALTAGREAVGAAARAPGSLYTWHARVCYAEALVESGRLEQGLQVIRAMGGSELVGLPPGFRPHRLRVLADGQLAAGRVDAAEATMRRLVREVGSSPLASHLAAVCHVRAGVLLARGDAHAAAQVAREAVAAYTGAGYRVEAARARLRAGQALSQAGDLGASKEELALALATLRDCGADRLSDRTAHELRELGIRMPPAETRRRARPEGPSVLSGRELQVAECMTEGMTNRQIAEHLFISQKTVERHMTHILAKLGVSSRAAAAVAIERWRAGNG